MMKKFLWTVFIVGQGGLLYAWYCGSIPLYSALAPVWIPLLVVFCGMGYVLFIQHLMGMHLSEDDDDVDIDESSLEKFKDDLNDKSKD